MHTEAALHDALKYRIDVTDTGTCRYYNALGQLHRDEGPAIIWDDGDLEWWQNGLRHREDGPAVEWHAGHKEWWVNDRLHRIDGPALTWEDGTPEWWIYGVRYTKQAYRAQLKTQGIAHDF